MLDLRAFVTRCFPAAMSLAVCSMGKSSASAAKRVVQELKANSPVDAPDAVGHRVVHGLSHTQPVRISDALIAELRQIQSLDPEHLPREIEIIEAMQREYPKVPH